MKKLLKKLCFCFVLCAVTGLFACKDEGGNASISSFDTGSENSSNIVLLDMEVTLQDKQEITYDGEYHFPILDGALPTGATTTWYFDDVLCAKGVKDAKTYAVKVEISCAGYNSLTLAGEYKIKPDYSKMAKDVMAAFGGQPEPWAFLPESFAIANKAVAKSAVPTNETYANFVDVSSLPTNYIGKQMNVVYGVLNTCDTALGYIAKVHDALDVIEQAYQIFINNDPANVAVFEGEVSAFNYKIELLDSYYTLTASISGVEVYLFGDTTNDSFGARVQLGTDNVLKYEVKDSTLKVAWNILNSLSTQIEFVNDDGVVKGYIYEYLTLEEAGLPINKATSTYLEVGEEYTTVVGTKGDFIPTADARNCEVYDNLTGKLVGTEVSESLEKSGTTFDTLWYNLRDIAGISSIKKVDEANGVNADTIYINGSSDTIHTKLAGITSGLAAGSRRFDIEFKEVCAYVYDAEKEKYEEVIFEIPMMFIQEKFVEDFEEDFASKNELDGAAIAVTLMATGADKQAVYDGYYTLVEIYNTIRNNITQQMIIDYCVKKTA